MLGAKFDRTLRHHQERVQDGDAGDHDRRKGHRPSAERNHPHRRGQHQPGQRLEKPKWTERNLRKRLPQLQAKRDCHGVTVPPKAEPWMAAVDKIAGKSVLGEIIPGTPRDLHRFRRSTIGEIRATSTIRSGRRSRTAACGPWSGGGLFARLASCVCGNAN